MITSLFPQADLRSGATFSDCGKYRYSLLRVWDDTKPIVCFIMLNPSTANAQDNDPTITRCIGFAKAWGFGGLVVVNLFVWRATDPKELRIVTDPIGPQNDEVIRAVTEGRRIIAAWGCNRAVGMRWHDVMNLLGDRQVEAIRITRDGHPEHPLYLPASCVPVPFRITGAA